MKPKREDLEGEEEHQRHCDELEAEQYPEDAELVSEMLHYVGRQTNGVFGLERLDQEALDVPPNHRSLAAFGVIFLQEKTELELHRYHSRKFGRERWVVIRRLDAEQWVPLCWPNEPSDVAEWLFHVFQSVKGALAENQDG